MTPQPENKPQLGAVVIGADFQTLGVVRSLVQEGVPVFLVEHEWGIARYSRYVSRRAYRPNLMDNFDAAADELLLLAEKEGLEGWTIFPNDDEVVKFLSQQKEKLSRSFRVSVPSWDVTQNVYFKQNTYRIARDLGVNIPTLHEGNSLREIIDQQPEYPLVLKPACKEGFFEATKKKAVRVENQEELEATYREFAELIDTENIVVQELVQGGAENLYSCATVFDGQKPLVAMCANRRRQHPMDFGQATTYAESVDRPELIELATQVLRGIGFTGIAEVEFLYDTKNHCYKLIEVNARPWGWNTLARASGVNIPLAMHRHLLGQPLGDMKMTEGMKWMRILTDFPTVFIEITRGRMSLRDYLRSWSGKKEFAVFSWRDPLPFLSEFAAIPYLWWKRGF